MAAVTTFAVAAGATGTDTGPYLVASRDLAPGTRLQPADLTVAHLHLDAAVGSHATAERSKLTGATTLGPIKAGELVQTGELANKVGGASQPEISFALPQSRALGGDLHIGETVDILSTDKNAASSTDARTAASGATVLRVEQGSSAGVGHSGDVTITVAVPDRSGAATVAAAVDQGQVTLVRTTGLDPSTVSSNASSSNASSSNASSSNASSNN